MDEIEDRGYVIQKTAGRAVHDSGRWGERERGEGEERRGKARTGEEAREERRTGGEREKEDKCGRKWKRREEMREKRRGTGRDVQRRG